MSRDVIVRRVRKAHSQPLSQWLAERRRTRAGIVPSEFGDGYLVTADHVIDDPREPRIMATGVLDSRGMMLMRVAMPIKVPMGFQFPCSKEPVQDEVEAIIPEDMLGVSDIGVGVGYLEPDEVEGDDVDLEALIRAALNHCDGDPACAKKLLAEQGLEVDFEVEAAPADETP